MACCRWGRLCADRPVRPLVVSELAGPPPRRPPPRFGVWPFSFHGGLFCVTCTVSIYAVGTKPIKNEPPGGVGVTPPCGEAGVEVEVRVCRRKVEVEASRASGRRGTSVGTLPSSARAPTGSQAGVVTGRSGVHSVCAENRVGPLDSPLSPRLQGEGGLSTAPALARGLRPVSHCLLLRGPRRRGEFPFSSCDVGRGCPFAWNVLCLPLALSLRTDGWKRKVLGPKASALLSWVPRTAPWWVSRGTGPAENATGSGQKHPFLPCVLNARVSIQAAYNLVSEKDPPPRRLSLVCGFESRCGGGGGRGMGAQTGGDRLCDLGRAPRPRFFSSVEWGFVVELL